MIQRKIILFALIFYIFNYSSAYPQETKTEEQKTPQKTSINWPDIPGAIMYEVEIADVNYKVILKEKVVPSNIEFSLPPGEYRIRIGPINKFYKIANWSDWAVVKSIGTAKKKKEIKEEVTFDNSVKIAVGIPYFQVMSPNNKYFNNSYSGGTFLAGARITTIIPFFNEDFLQHLGLEVEGTYIKFEGKKIPNRIKTNKIDMFYGVNLYIATNFKSPLNFIARGGGGVIQTRFEYADSVINDLKKYNDNTLTSIDFYYKAGASVEFNFFKYCLIEAGADFYDFRYISTSFRVLRYYCAAGVMF
jgi:hypothetical protein